MTSTLNWANLTTSIQLVGRVLMKEERKDQLVVDFLFFLFDIDTADFLETRHASCEVRRSFWGSPKDWDKNDSRWPILTVPKHWIFKRASGTKFLSHDRRTGYVKWERWLAFCPQVPGELNDLSPAELLTQARSHIHNSLPFLPIKNRSSRDLICQPFHLLMLSTRFLTSRVGKKRGRFCWCAVKETGSFDPSGSRSGAMFGHVQCACDLGTQASICQYSNEASQFFQYLNNVNYMDDSRWNRTTVLTRGLFVFTCVVLCAHRDGSEG